MKVQAGRGSAQYMLRLPDGLRDQIKTDAESNGRSMNTEIIARLSGTQANLRDQFAMHVAAGMAAFSGTSGVSYGPGQIAGRSYEIADALLAARKGGDA